jgi:hypothetical protein
MIMVRQIVSGGQTGVDRAALDEALELGIPRGGWCPKGRRAEDGRIPDHYPLQEASSDAYPLRTKLNVEDSDGTLILSWGSPAGGTALTIKWARRLKKPCILIDLFQKTDPLKVLDWLRDHHIQILNVAGPREGEAPGIYEKALSFLREVFATVR